MSLNDDGTARARGSRQLVAHRNQRAYARPPARADEERSFAVVYEVDAHPFAGTLRDALLLSDVTDWRDAIAKLRPPADLTLGGGRAAELHLHVEPSDEGRWAVEVQLRRSGDDPWPEIRYLVFGVEPFASSAVEGVAVALREHS